MILKDNNYKTLKKYYIGQFVMKWQYIATVVVFWMEFFY